MNTDKQRQDAYWKKAIELSNKIEELKDTPKLSVKKRSDGVTVTKTGRKSVCFTIHKQEHLILDLIGKFLGLKQKRPAHSALSILIDKFIQENYEELITFIKIKHLEEELDNKRNELIEKYTERTNEH